jgi:type I restriction-modification system DNA methylase subunit
MPAPVPIKKSDLYSSLWRSCDELRGGMDASQYKDYVLVLLFVKYVSDKAASQKNYLLEVPKGGSFADMVELKGKKDIGEQMNKIVAKLAQANDVILKGVIDVADWTTTSWARKRTWSTGCRTWSPSSTTQRSTFAATVPRATTCSATPTST